MPAVRSVMKTVGGDNARWSAIVTAIVASQPFTMRMPAEVKPKA